MRADRGVVEQARVRWLRRQSRQRVRTDELQGRLGQNWRNVRAGVDELSADLRSLVRRDATGDAKDDELAF